MPDLLLLPRCDVKGNRARDAAEVEPARTGAGLLEGIRKMAYPAKAT
jgi:hypothetical protein